MLVLTFRVGGVPYGVAVGKVVEVVPRVPLRAMPHAPRYLSGLLRYRGDAIPVIDLGLLMAEGAGVERLDTRIILVDAGPRGRLGLVAERVEDVVEIAESKRATGGAAILDAPYLGSVYEIEGGLLQLVEPSQVPTGPVALALTGAGEVSG